MRQGPNYTMPVRRATWWEDQGVTTIMRESEAVPVPLELVSEFEGVEFVKWTANKNGTFTLTLFDTVI